MKKNILSACLLLIAAYSYAQPRITNVDFYVSGESIIVTYNLLKTTSDQLFNTELYVNFNNGTWQPLQQVSGDIGANTYGGTGKRITWNALQEYTEVVGDLSFRIIGYAEEEVSVEEELEEEVIENEFNTYEPVRFTNVELSKRTKGCEDDYDATKCYSLDISYPQLINYDFPIFQTFINLLLGGEQNPGIEQAFNNFLQFAERLDHGDGYLTMFDESRSIEVEYNKKGIFSTSVNETSSSGGTVNYDKVFLNIDTETGKLIKLEELLDISPYMYEHYLFKTFVVEKMNNYLILTESGIVRLETERQRLDAEELKYKLSMINFAESNDSYLFELAKSYFKQEQEIEEIEDSGYFYDTNGEFYLNGNFCFTDEGLLFSYSKYEIASGSAGIPQFLIPYEDLKPILKEDSLIWRFLE